MSCGNSVNSPEFIKAAEGRYSFNSDEAIEVYFEENILKVKWRGKDMTPIKANDSSFYVKEMNEKLVFITTPQMHIKLAEKREHKGAAYLFHKLPKGHKTPTEYFKNKEYDKALKGYIAIKKKDSTDPAIRERTLNRLGYQYLSNNKFQEAIEIFKINIALYPYKSNVYDSMGDVYARTKDTVKALEFYKKALSINPENRKAKRFVSKHNKK